MILLLFSFFYYCSDLDTYKSGSVYTGDIKFEFSIKKSWVKGILESGLGVDYSPEERNAGFHDFKIGVGLEKEIRGFTFGILPIMHIPSGNTGEIRNFSINGYGYGAGMKLSKEVLNSFLGVEGRFLEYATDPNIRSLELGGELKINPDTLTFGIDIKFVRFMGNNNNAISSIYLTPEIEFNRWRRFSVNLGFSFRIFRDKKSVDELINAGLNLDDIGIPPWKISLGISSPHEYLNRENIYTLRVMLVDEKGDLTDGLISLADSGSFTITEGEKLFTLREGIYPLSIYAENYIPVDTTVILRKNTEILMRIRHRESFGILEGKVIDSESKKSLFAKIEIRNSEQSSLYTKAETGEYRVLLKPGDYIFQVSSSGYHQKTSLIEVKANYVSNLNFELFPILKE